uniref:Uncharacterized protein n=1 Tax=Bradyrhizobium ottawaense TaxID=931866 RepID=A0A2U8PBF5_9BRAD|nr:hypothetical protein CIT37_25325 [Bradyrhizobium ottawaense]
MAAVGQAGRVQGSRGREQSRAHGGNERGVKQRPSCDHAQVPGWPRMMFPLSGEDAPDTKQARSTGSGDSSFEKIDQAS